MIHSLFLFCECFLIIIEFNYQRLGLYIDITTNLKKENRFYKTHPSAKIKLCTETFWYLNLGNQKLNNIKCQIGCQNQLITVDLVINYSCYI